MGKNKVEIENQDQDYKPYQRRGIRVAKRKIEKKEIIEQYFNTSQWSLEEDKLYIKFIKENVQYFKNIESRKKHKIFFQMSQFIRLRSPDQCRSHHQKKEKKFKTIAAICQWAELNGIFIQSENESAMPLQKNMLKDRQSPDQQSLSKRVQSMKTCAKQQDTPCFEIRAQQKALNDEKERQLWDFLSQNVWCGN